MPLFARLAMVAETRHEWSMRVLRREITTLQIVGAAWLSLPGALYGFIKVGGDLDFVTSLFGWESWRVDVLTFLSDPPGWALSLFVLFGVGLLLLGERKRTDAIQEADRESATRLSQHTEARLADGMPDRLRSLPEIKAIQDRALADCLEHQVAMVQAWERSIEAAWAGIVEISALQWAQGSMQSAHEAPYYHFQASLRAGAAVSTRFKRMSISGEHTHYFQPNRTVPGEEVAADEQKLANYRKHFDLKQRALADLALIKQTLETDISQLRHSWTKLGMELSQTQDGQS